MNRGPQGDAELACAFVASRLERAVGRRHLQGRRHPPLPCRAASPAVRLFAEQRLYRVPAMVARALLAWADGFPVERLDSVPEPEHVLALQAEGARCVSLLGDGVPTAPHKDALAFALHDLCHLAKFIEPEHYVGQVGFSAAVQRALLAPRWPAFLGEFDAIFLHDVHHVIADMNGSAIFLFAALKMKLKMAVRRRHAKLRGVPARVAGPLTPEEADTFVIWLDEFLSLFDMDAMRREVARAVSTRRDLPDAAQTLLQFFQEIGQGILRRRWGSAQGPISRWHEHPRVILAGGGDLDARSGIELRRSME